MDLGFKIPEKGTLDFLSLGALVNRLDPGIIPFRKATQAAIHVSGGEFNVAANLSRVGRIWQRCTATRALAFAPR